MSPRRREAAHSLGAGRRLSHSTCFLLPSDGGDAETLHSLPLTDSSSRVLFLFSQPRHLAPSLTPACHFHFFSPPSLPPAFPSVRSPSLTLHSLVIPLTVHALSTVKADCNQQRHPHGQKAGCCRQCFTLSLRSVPSLLFLPLTKKFQAMQSSC